MILKFKLSDMEDISFFKNELNLSVNGFSLTNSDLWIDFGKVNFYEYTNEGVHYSKMNLNYCPETAKSSMETKTTNI